MKPPDLYSLQRLMIALKTGAGTTASRLGQPDLAIAQFYEMRENADMIAGLDPYGPPLIADMDTGYGGKKWPLVLFIVS
jgi:2-methylisocitrate lyase-like PEP mutase family enzyme